MTDRPARKGASRPSARKGASRPSARKGASRPARSPGAPSPSPAAESRSEEDGPLTLRLAVLLLWIQSACVGVLAVTEVVALFRTATSRFEWAAWVIAGPVVAGVGLWVAGRLLVHRRVAGRGLAVALQLCAVPVVFFMVAGDNDPWVRLLGVVVGASVLACLALVVAPPSRRALFGN